MNPNNKILIVEDELVIAHTLQEMLKEIGFSSIEIANTFSLAQEAMNKRPFDLALLDINLGNGDDGIQLSSVAKNCGLKFIYITSYSDKVTLDKALNTFPAAYINKPVLQHNLYSAVNIALNQPEKATEQMLKLEEGTKIIVIPIASIQYIHSENNYIKIVSEEKNYLIRMTLSKVQEQLDPRVFIQIHRSYVVNSREVSHVEPAQLTIKGHRIPVSRTYKQAVRDHFKFSL